MIYLSPEDRLQQTVAGQTTTYTLDLNAGLTQVLSDGTNTYLYGNDLIAQQNGADSEYFLGDALGSVRQLTNGSGDVTLARAYDPYGETILNVGSVQTAFGYAGQWGDGYIKLMDLRSRWYDTDAGRFISKDTWQGDQEQPMSYNAWLYVDANPINFTDPSGNIKEGPEDQQAQQILSDLTEYNVFINKDWGPISAFEPEMLEPEIQVDENGKSTPAPVPAPCDWIEGNWNLDELIWTKEAIEDVSEAMVYVSCVSCFLLNLLQDRKYHSNQSHLVENRYANIN